MPLSRGKFPSLAAAGAASSLVAEKSVQARTAAPFKAIAFDSFPIFDPRPVFPGRLLH
ncbi:MAG: hypothetical protein HY067_04605 [Betaproteobacteria bacterium]|nr:hypothetical protein [Betaproteobacteria bacterium]